LRNPSNEKKKLQRYKKQRIKMEKGQRFLAHSREKYFSEVLKWSPDIQTGDYSMTHKGMWGRMGISITKHADYQRTWKSITGIPSEN
jgi:hypothetical protein